MGAGEIPALRPVFASVSRTISSLILLKSKNFWPGMCRNSPHSSALFWASDDLISSETPFACGAAARLMSWRMSGLRVTIPVPRGRLHAWLLAVVASQMARQQQALTSLVQQYSQARNSFHWTAILRRRFEANLWGFEPGLGISLRPRQLAVTCLPCESVEGKQHTPTVVKTSWSLLTSVMSPGSFTLILYTALALHAARGCLGHVPTHLGLSP